MRWKDEEPINLRSRWMFCLAPVNFNGMNYWLEWVYICEKYEHYYDGSQWKIIDLHTREEMEQKNDS